MTKAEEIKALAAFAKKLGPDTYLGPALSKLVPWVELEVRSDVEPDLVGLFQKMTDDLIRVQSELKGEMGRFEALATVIRDRELEIRRLDAGIVAARGRASDALREMSRLELSGVGR
jgi:hypothetical protein